MSIKKGVPKSKPAPAPEAAIDADEADLTPVDKRGLVINRLIRRLASQSCSEKSVVSQVAKFELIIRQSPDSPGAKEEALGAAEAIAAQVLSEAFSFVGIAARDPARRRATVESPWRIRLKNLIGISGLKVAEVAGLFKDLSGERGFAHRTLQCWLSDPASSTHRACPEWPVTMLANHLWTAGAIQRGAYIEATGKAPVAPNKMAKN